MRSRVAAVVAVALAASAVAIGQGPRRDGKWEVTMEMDMPGMPMRMQPITTTHCVTKEQANDPRKIFPQQQGRSGRTRDDSRCHVADQKVEGNKMTWTMKCEGEQPMTAAGEVTYTNDTYAGSIKMDMSGRGTMTMKYSGRRVGECEGGD